MCLPLYPRYLYGDVVGLKGNCQAPGLLSQRAAAGAGGTAGIQFPFLFLEVRFGGGVTKLEFNALDELSGYPKQLPSGQTS